MLTRYESFDRSRWSELRKTTPLTLTDEDLAELRGINEELDLEEVADVYLPISRLLNLQIVAKRHLGEATDTFLGSPVDRIPYVIGLAGSVAVGKSTAARVLQSLLANWDDHPGVALVTTDGFLFPNQVLEDNDLMGRKGFPESYDTSALVEFLRRVKSGVAEVHAPVYSHLTYDIVPDETVAVRQPDVLIVEGLNVLQAGRGAEQVVSDFFDFSIFVDAEEAHIEQWYVDRFLTLRESVFTNPDSYFQHYAALDEETAIAVARGIWADINAVNLRENIAPTRERADLILTKAEQHRVEQVFLRKT